MTRSVGERTPSRDRAARQRRTAEIEARLAAYGLLSRTAPRAVGSAEDATPPAARLAAALVELGPVFAAFGGYLADRLDVLLERDAAPLAGLSPPPVAIAEVQAALAGGPLAGGPLAGGPLAGALETLDPRPLAVTLRRQVHRARLVSGAAVTVEVARPREVLLEEELELLDLVVPAVPADGLPSREREAALRAVIADFRRHVVAPLDLAAEAAAWSSLDRSPLLAPARVVAELSTPAAVVRELPRGVSLAELVESARTEPAAGADEVAARLCRGWLAQALDLAVHLPAPPPALVVATPDERLEVLGGGLESAPQALAAGLWTYLEAVAGEDPDAAVTALGEHLDGGRPGSADLLRQRFRQAVPFRDGGPGAGSDLAGQLFLQWRLATGVGYRSRPHLVRFLAGVAGLARVVRRLSWYRDPLREGLETARLAAGIEEVGRRLQLGQLGRTADAYAALAMALPQRLDQVLTQAADGKIHLDLRIEESPGDRVRRGSRAAFVALAMALVAVVLLAGPLTAALELGPWSDRLTTAVVLVLGVAMLRAGSRAL